MKRRHLLAVLAATVAALGISAASVAAPPQNFVAPLSGDAERPLPRETQARGVGIFQVAPDGESIRYRLIASNIENVIMAHIHLGPEEGSGGIVVWLYPDAPPPEAPGAGRHDGVLATGTITEEDLVGALAGQDLSALIDAMAAGNTYVNVHTNDGMGDPNTGPGDFPGGEIRGQL